MLPVFVLLVRQDVAAKKEIVQSYSGKSIITGLIGGICKT
jgi:hypothetical protein